MIKILLFSCFIALSLTAFGKKKEFEQRTIPIEVLKDKIAGGWAGKMIGVSYGVPTEFKAHGFTFEDSIKWTPSDIKLSLLEDDIYSRCGRNQGATSNRIRAATGTSPTMWHGGKLK